MPETGPELTRESIATTSRSRPVRRGGPASTSFRWTRGGRYEPRCRCGAFGLLKNPMAERARRWQAGFPVLETDDDTLAHTYLAGCGAPAARPTGQLPEA